MAAGAPSTSRICGSGGDGTQLLPGVSNEITLAKIAPKMPWRVFHILSSVSRGWQEAIQSREVYDARVSAQSTETVVCFLKEASVEDGHADDSDTFALYSVGEKCCCQLPPIPQLDGRFLWSCAWISLDGKMYVLGGTKNGTSMLATAEVYVLDVAGQRQWEQCASMQQGRYGFECGVVDGKIYVLGGANNGEPVLGSEVYDPKVNTWRSIMPIPFGRINHHVSTLGDELLVYSGRFACVEDTSVSSGEFDQDEDIEILWRDAPIWEVYHPAQNEWREVKPLGDRVRASTFMAKGKLYRMTGLGIDLFDFDRRSWTNRHTNSFAAIGPVNSRSVEISSTLAVQDEILAVLYCSSNDSSDFSGRRLLLQSKGFDSEDKEIVWQCKNWSLSRSFTEMRPVQL